jgi:hypothetical protein
VIGSELLMRACPAGSSSEMTWLSRKPSFDSLASGVQVPGAGSLADGVPGPHRARLHRLGVARLQRTLPHCDSTQIQSPSSMPAGSRAVRVDEQVVVRVDLAQPGVLRVPGVVHRHRPLRHRGERVLVLVGDLRFERLVIEGQRVEVGLDALFQVRRRLARDALALRREAEALQHLGIQVDQDRLGVARDAVGATTPGSPGSSCACTGSFGSSWW